MIRTALLVSLPPALVLSACADPVGPTVDAPFAPDVRAYVVGDAARALDSRGRFRLAPPAPRGDSDSLITPEQAAELALAYIRTFIANPDVITLLGEPFRVQLENWHGHPVDWSAVEVEVQARPAYFAESYLEPLPSEMPRFVHLTLGPHYMVPLHVRGDRVATVRVAALATDVRVGEDGFVRKPASSGGEFGQAAPGHEWGYSVPPSPEYAVEFVATATGAKITEVPRPGQVRPRAPATARIAR